MFNMVIILLATLNSEPVGTNDYRISRFILSNLKEIHQYNISQLAKACFVSNSSISRFCRKIGFRDFNELKHQFFQWTDIGREKFAYQGCREEALKDSYIDGIIENLQLLKKSIQAQELQQLARDILTFSKVAAFGSLHSQSVVLNLQTDLLTSGIVMDTRTRFQEQLEYIEEADSETLILLFSRGGSHLKRFLIHDLQLSQSNRPKIVMITANRGFRTNKYIDQFVYYDEQEGFTAYPYAFEAIKGILALEVYMQKNKNEKHLK
ncbi:MurR/RpiR family transcriptional regulator [Enterococcus sp. BWM-S5]|uniref:MurR/RpiR family transcriptional regulator n=1 Tax=Enterococcus larvae TaxID=2794352 RepID=A0ABS4CQG4_9ENTE|nr:MurR/RpiR family transcriptional regulator [Enterococcus larvae]MBP1048024.1 MurR/RpiR family transcriptional regulator [Enterococcus larvae]